MWQKQESEIYESPSVAYRRGEGASRPGRHFRRGRHLGRWKKIKEKKKLKKEDQERQKETIIAYRPSYTFMVLPFISKCFFVYFNTYLFRNDFEADFHKRAYLYHSSFINFMWNWIQNWALTFPFKHNYFCDTIQRFFITFHADICLSLRPKQLKGNVETNFSRPNSTEDSQRC